MPITSQHYSLYKPISLILYSECAAEKLQMCFGEWIHVLGLQWRAPQPISPIASSSPGATWCSLSICVNDLLGLPGRNSDSIVSTSTADRPVWGQSIAHPGSKDPNVPFPQSPGGHGRTIHGEVGGKEPRDPRGRGWSGGQVREVSVGLFSEHTWFIWQFLFVGM